MMCAVCASTVEKTVSGCEGVVDSAVNFASSEVSVTWGPSVTSPEAIAESVAKAGYAMIVEDSAAKAVEEKEREELKIYSGMKRDLILAWGSPPHPFQPYACFIFTSQLRLCDDASGSGCDVLLRPALLHGGFRNLLRLHPNMDSLVAVSTLVSFCFSLFNTLFPEFFAIRSMPADLYYEASAMIIAFVLTGKFPETRARRNTGAAIKALMGLQPTEAMLIADNGEMIKVEISEIKPATASLCAPATAYL